MLVCLSASGRAWGRFSWNSWRQPHPPSQAKWQSAADSKVAPMASFPGYVNKAYHWSPLRACAPPDLRHRVFPSNADAPITPLQKTNSGKKLFITRGTLHPWRILFPFWKAAACFASLRDLKLKAVGHGMDPYLHLLNPSYSPMGRGERTGPPLSLLTAFGCFKLFSTSWKCFSQELWQHSATARDANSCKLCSNTPHKCTLRKSCI